MRSINSQSGQSLVEAVVAAALVGVAVVSGLETLSAAVGASRLASHQAWARCEARGELELIGASAWDPGSYPAPPGVQVNVTAAAPGLELVGVTVADPDSGRPLLTAEKLQIYKSQALSGPAPVTATQTDALAQSCSALVGT